MGEGGGYIVTRSGCEASLQKGSHTHCKLQVASASHVNQTPLPNINQPDVPVMSRCRYLCPSLMDLSLFLSPVISI